MTAPHTLDVPAQVLATTGGPAPLCVPIDRALVCPACAVTFAAQRVCPACGGGDLYPLRAFLERQQGRAYVETVIKELRELRVVKESSEPMKRSA